MRAPVLLSALAASCVLAHQIPFTNDKRPSIDFKPPRTMLGKFCSDMTSCWGEPLNVVISAKSDPFVLQDKVSVSRSDSMDKLKHLCRVSLRI
jgi:hypothetical protein